MRLLTQIQKQTHSSIYRPIAFSFSESKVKSQLYNPYTKQLVSAKDYLQDDQIFTKLTAATSAYSRWKKVALDQRFILVKQFVRSVLLDKEKLKPIIAAQIGKSYQNIDEEFKRIELLFEDFIQSGRKSLNPQIIEQQPHKIKKVIFQPVGLSLIFPYFSQPLFDSIVNLIPCLISGNGALLKPSDFNHFLGPYLEEKSNQVFNIEGLITEVFIQPKQLPVLAEFRSLKKVLYSGSVQSAKHIFETLIRKRFIDCNLFFGGKDAAFVDQTADLQLAARQIIANAFYNNGQSYDCIKRVYIEQKIQSQFLQLMRNEISKIKYGNPQSADTLLGPLCVMQNATLTQSYINDSISSGAVCQIGGLAASDGTQAVFFQPTLLSSCTNDMMIVQTQINAPVLCAITASRQNVARQINESEFGTGVRIFTKQPQKYDQIVNQLELGKISFNSGSLFDYNLPIEGWKGSGKGKILSELSFEQFSIPKSLNIKQL